MERTFLDLRIERGREGTWHLKQDVGPCDDSTEHWIVLETEHLETLARMAGFVPAVEIDRACERDRDRLNLLAAMVKAHTREGDPLRAAVACLIGRETVAEPFEDPSKTLPSPIREAVPKTVPLPLETR